MIILDAQAKLKLNTFSNIALCNRNVLSDNSRGLEDESVVHSEQYNLFFGEMLRDSLHVMISQT